MMVDVHKRVSPIGWNPKLNAKLEFKVLGKVARLRTKMLEKGDLVELGGAYVYNDHQGSPFPTSGDIGDFRAAVNALPKDRWEDAFEILVQGIDKDRVMLACGNWIMKTCRSR